MESPYQTPVSYFTYTVNLRLETKQIKMEASHVVLEGDLSQLTGLEVKKAIDEKYAPAEVIGWILQGCIQFPTWADYNRFFASMPQAKAKENGAVHKSSVQGHPVKMTLKDKDGKVIDER